MKYTAGFGKVRTQNPNYTYLNSGTYDITLIAHSPSNIGCNDTITFPITIFPSFTLNSSLDITPCSPKVDFTVNSSFDGLFPIDYFWDFGDVSILEDTSNLVNPNYTYLNPGSYNISIIAITDSPACGDTANLQVTIYPEFTFTPTIKNIKCTTRVQSQISQSATPRFRPIPSMHAVMQNSTPVRLLHSIFPTPHTPDRH